MCAAEAAPKCTKHTTYNMYYVNLPLVEYVENQNTSLRGCFAKRSPAIGWLTQAGDLAAILCLPRSIEDYLLLGKAGRLPLKNEVGPLSCGRQNRPNGVAIAATSSSSMLKAFRLPKLLEVEPA